MRSRTTSGAVTGMGDSSSARWPPRPTRRSGHCTAHPRSTRHFPCPFKFYLKDQGFAVGWIVDVDRERLCDRDGFHFHGPVLRQLPPPSHILRDRDVILVAGNDSVPLFVSCQRKTAVGGDRCTCGFRLRLVFWGRGGSHLGTQDESTPSIGFIVEVQLASRLDGRQASLTLTTAET